MSEYLIGCYQRTHRAFKEKYTIRVISDTPVNEEAVKACIRDHCAQEQDKIRHEMKEQTFRELSLAFLGAAILTIWFILSSTWDSVVGLEILSIMGWVAIWEATSIAIMRRPELHALKRTYAQAAQAEIVVELAENA